MLAILFSRDRAMQLDAALRSFSLHCRDFNRIKTTVLYVTSNEQHTRQYIELQIANPHVKFLPQVDFRADLLTNLNPYPPHSPGGRLFGLFLRLSQIGYAGGLWSKRAFRIGIGQHMATWMPDPGDLHYLFLTDDNIFVRDFTLQPAVDALRTNPDALGFSLRLGRNTTYSYMQDQQQPLPDFIDLGQGVLKYAWTHASADFGYPMEVSSSVFRARDFSPYTLGLNFDNPNSLEAEISRRNQRFARKMPALLCFAQSVTFCNPVNKVQQSFAQNRAFENYSYSIQELADRFEHREQIQIESYSGFVPSSCHQEVELVFEQRNGTAT